MKKIIVLFTAIVLFSLSVIAQDKDLIKVPLDNYLQGHATGKGEFHQKAIYPESRLLWVRDGKLNQRTTAEYIKGSSGKPADDEASRKRWVEMVEIKGNAAIAKIILDYPTAYFVDYFALLKIDGEWKIVNKSFDVLRRTNPTEKVSFTATAEEKKAVAVPLENYIKAQATGNGEFMRKALHTEAKVMFFSEGKFNQWSAEEFAGRFNGKAADDEAKRKRLFEILDIAGNAAIAKVTLDYPTVTFTDSMTLLKIDGEWKIINKTFYREPKEQPKK
jgi:Putative lumazine-binding